MRCRVETSVLQAHLALVAGAIVSRGARPDWSALSMRAQPSDLMLAVDNPQFGIRTQLSADVSEAGEAAVPARIVIDFISSVDDHEIELRYDEEQASLVILCSAYDPQIRGVQMPLPIQPLPVAASFSIPADTLLEAVRDTYYGASTDEHRPALTGLLVQAHGPQLRVTSTDGSRILQRRCALGTDMASQEDLLVPARALQEALRVFAGESADLHVGLSEARNQMLLAAPSGNEMRTLLLHGRYPDVQPMLGLQGATVIHTTGVQLVRKLRATNLFATESDHIVRLVVRNGGLRLMASTKLIGEIETVVDAVIEGSDCQVAINGRYLLEVCSRMEGHEVDLHLTDEGSPVVVRRYDDPNFECVIMPMRISAPMTA